MTEERTWCPDCGRTFKIPAVKALVICPRCDRAFDFTPSPVPSEGLLDADPNCDVCKGSGVDANSALNGLTEWLTCQCRNPANVRVPSEGKTVDRATILEMVHFVEKCQVLAAEGETDWPYTWSAVADEALMFDCEGLLALLDAKDARLQECETALRWLLSTRRTVYIGKPMIRYEITVPPEMSEKWERLAHLQGTATPGGKVICPAESPHLFLAHDGEQFEEIECAHCEMGAAEYIASLEAERDKWRHAWARESELCTKAVAERDALQAEVERLRELSGLPEPIWKSWDETRAECIRLGERAEAAEDEVARLRLEVSESRTFGNDHAEEWIAEHKRAEAAEQRLVDVSPYVSHLPACEWGKRPIPGTSQCTCGLAALDAAKKGEQ